jgi:ferric-dicitrate binding protein FerR (iron transport regulator)
MSDISERIYDLATRYLVHSQIETEQERQERERWLAEDPRHRQAYDEMTVIDEVLTSAAADPELRARAAQHLDALRRLQEKK